MVFMNPRGQLHLDLLERPTIFILVQTGFGRCCQWMEHCGARSLADNAISFMTANSGGFELMPLFQ